MNRAVCIASLWVCFPLNAYAQQNGNVPPIPNEAKKMTFGNIAVSGYQKFGGNFNKAFRYSGPNTLVTVTDKDTRSVLKLHADTIELKIGKKEQVGVIDMTGSVRFDVVQNPTDGTKRTLNGTAGKGIYSPDAKTIELSGRVNATFFDEARLATPGTLKASRIKVGIGRQPYAYDITGGASAAINFAPRPAANAKPETAQVKQVRVNNFQTGTFRPGEQAGFRGTETVAEFDISDGGTAKIEGDALEASFGGDKATLTKAEAQGNARYSFVRPGSKGKREETAKGSSASAVYDVASATMTLDGRVDATVIAPDSLQSPARLIADRITFRTEKPYRYEIVSTPERALLKFTPLPPKDDKTDPKTSKPEDATRRLIAGEIKITNFAQGTFEPGVRVALSGGKPIFESADPDSKASTRLQAAQLIATFDTAETNAIGKTEATGGVTFAIVQPKTKDKAQTALRGKANKAVFTNVASSRRVDLTGPLAADVIDPDNLIEPGKVTGGDDTVLSVLFLKEGYDIEIESPKETSSVQFKPKEAPKDNADAKKVAQPDKKK